MKSLHQQQINNKINQIHNLNNQYQIIVEKKKIRLLVNVDNGEHPVVIAIENVIVIIVHLVEIEIEIEIYIIITHLRIVGTMKGTIIIVDDVMMIDIVVVIIVDDILHQHHREIDIMIDMIDIKVNKIFSRKI